MAEHLAIEKIALYSEEPEWKVFDLGGHRFSKGLLTFRLEPTETNEPHYSEKRQGRFDFTSFTPVASKEK